MAQVTGLTTDQLQNLQRAAGLSGVSVEDMSHGIRILSREMFAAKNGTGDAGTSFQHLGIKIKNADGSLRSANDVLLDLADKFQKMPDGAEKTAEAMKVLGRGGAALIPVLNKGRDGIAEMAGQFPNLTEEQIAASAELIKTQKSLAFFTKSLWQQAIAPLLPAINSLLKRYLEWRKANAAIMSQAIHKYIGYVITAVNKVADGFSFLAKNIGAVVGILGSAGLIAVMVAFGHISVITALQTAAAWALAALPFLGIAAAVAAILLIYDDLRTYNEDEAKHSKKQHSLYGVLKQRLDELYKDRPKPPFLQHMIDFVETLRHAGDWIGSFKRDLNELSQFMADMSKMIGGMYDAIMGAIAHDPARILKGLQQIQSAQSNYGAGAAVSRGNPGFKGWNSGPAAGQKVMPTNTGVDIMNSPFANDTPEYRAGGGKADWNIQAPVNITVTQQPGEDSEQFAQRVGSIVDDHWNGKMEEAQSGVSR